MNQSAHSHALPEGGSRSTPRPLPTLVPIETGSDGFSMAVKGRSGWLIIDAGFDQDSWRRFVVANQISPEDVKGMLVTHEHRSHVRSLRWFVSEVSYQGTTLIASSETISRTGLMRKENQHRCLTTDSGFSITLGKFRITAVLVAHDAACPHAWRMEEEGGDQAVGVVVDAGSIDPEMIDCFEGVGEIFVSPRFDGELLRGSNEISPADKRRIASGVGHLDNRQALEFINRIDSPDLHRICLGHWDARFNGPEEVVRQCRRTVETGWSRIELMVRTETGEQSIHPFAVPECLGRLTRQDIEAGPLPVDDILAGSLYYPASRFDGDPVRHFGHLFHSFVYADYGVRKDDFDRQLETPGFRGYDLVGRRDLSLEEVLPSEVCALACEREGPSWAGDCFATWCVFQRASGWGPEHGPQRLSLLYLGTEGVETYRALYGSRGLAPRGLAIIQPGEGFGNNWTDFKEPGGPLWEAVVGGDSSYPEYLLFGGLGRRSQFRRSCWPGYDRFLRWVPKTSWGTIALWERSADPLDRVPLDLIRRRRSGWLPDQWQP